MFVCTYLSICTRDLYKVRKDILILNAVSFRASNMNSDVLNIDISHVRGMCSNGLVTNYLHF